MQLHYIDLLAESLQIYKGPLSSSQFTHYHGDPNSDDIMGPFGEMKVFLSSLALLLGNAKLADVFMADHSFHR